MTVEILPYRHRGGDYDGGTRTTCLSGNSGAYFDDTPLSIRVPAVAIAVLLGSGIGPALAYGAIAGVLGIG